MDTPTPIKVITGEKVATNAANEGIPVAAIARLLETPFEAVIEHLKDAKSRGVIADMPRADWPPGTRLNDRTPSAANPTDDDLCLVVKQAFHLTGLEASFLVVLLRHRQVDKTRLHNIVEQKRSTRATQPSSQEATDPKMVDVMICKLRKKLKSADPHLLIATIWGGGYYIDSKVKPLIIAYANGDHHAPLEARDPACPITNGDPISRIQ